MNARFGVHSGLNSNIARSEKGPEAAPHLHSARGVSRCSPGHFAVGSSTWCSEDESREEPMDVAAWLCGLGLGQYEQAFRENDIDAEILMDLTAED
jgi:hypothetical protein